MTNRNYLSLFAVVGALLGASVAAGAQPAPSPAPAASGAPATAGAMHRHHGSRMGRALRGLGLSADQRARIKTLMTSYRSSRSSATPETRQQLVAGVENVLTPAQRTQFETAMQRKPRGASDVPAASPTP